LLWEIGCPLVAMLLQANMDSKFGWGGGVGGEGASKFP